MVREGGILEQMFPSVSAVPILIVGAVVSEGLGRVDEEEKKEGGREEQMMIRVIDR